MGGGQVGLLCLENYKIQSYDKFFIRVTFNSSYLHWRCRWINLFLTYLPTSICATCMYVCMYVGSTNNINIVVTHPNIHTQANRPFFRFLFRRSGILRHERLKFYIDGNWGAAIAQWIRLLLSSSRPGVRVPSTLSALL